LFVIVFGQSLKMVIFLFACEARLMGLAVQKNVVGSVEKCCGGWGFC
jgi:hypothetical protein